MIPIIPSTNFHTCISCCNKCYGKVANRKGTFIAITPADNILLFASILYSGAAPAKVLWMMNHMRVACISDQTFFYIKTGSLNQALRLCGVSISQGYWHSAKLRVLLFSLVVMDKLIALDIHGLYDIIDLKTNKVLHIELAQP